MSDQDKVPETGGRGIADKRTNVDWKEVFLHSRDRPPSAKAGALVGDMVTELASDMVTELGGEGLGGISPSRLEAILGGEDPTNDELEEVGYVFIELMRDLKHK